MSTSSGGAKDRWERLGREGLQYLIGAAVLGEPSPRAPGRGGTLGWAILGVLAAHQPLSGYDLARYLGVSLGIVWQAGHSQIYPELARLELQKYVAHRAVEQDDRPDKKLYSITGAGRTALREWVATPVKPPAIRDDLLVKAYASWLADQTELASLFREHERHHRRQLARCQRMLDVLLDDHPGEVESLVSPLFSIQATLRRAVGYEREYADWCDWMATRLAASSGPRTRRPQTRRATT